VIASASGNGKTTLARQAAARIGVPCVELDALVHGPSWTETSNEALRARLAPVL
jgi:adenylate kinase family enzyme